MQGLNQLLSKNSQLHVLRILHHAEGSLTGREIERRSGLSNRATMVALDTLCDISAVIKASEGNAYLFTINRDNYFVSKALKPAFDAEDMFWEDLRKTIRRVVRPR
ncbi:MAG: hypothetical protein EOM12_15750, partial [Verrucomicrobiae bacterium]|nr:hypothetical protein [Verrucomicrobiae bacterium]